MCREFEIIQKFPCVWACTVVETLKYFQKIPVVGIFPLCVWATVPEDFEIKKSLWWGFPPCVCATVPEDFEIFSKNPCGGDFPLCLWANVRRL